MTARSLAVRRFVLVAVIVPAAVALIGAAVQVLALPSLDETIAIHWNAAGEPDGFAPAWTQPLMTLGFGFGVPALIALPALPALLRGDGGFTYRLLGATATWTSVFVVTIFTWTLLLQNGEDGADAVAIGRVMLSALLIASAAGAAAWFAQPRTEARRVPTGGLAPIPVSATERVAWVRTSTMHPIAAWALWGIAVAMVLFGTIMIVQQLEGGWVLLIVGAVLTVAGGATTTFRVAVTESGLRVRSVWGVPRFLVASADIVSVEVVEVNPMGEFGGWGLRAAPGRTGVVLRSGEAIEVTRRDGRRFVVTVADAATGVALLQSYASRAASDSL